MIWAVLIFVLTGFGFLSVAAIGAIRLPDFYTRSHAIAVTDTLGTLLILGGLMIHYGFNFDSAKLFLIVLFIYVANPTITHALVRAAYRSGLSPWKVKSS